MNRESCKFDMMPSVKEVQQRLKASQDVLRDVLPSHIVDLMISKASAETSPWIGSEVEVDEPSVDGHLNSSRNSDSSHPQDKKSECHPFGSSHTSLESVS